MNVIHINFLLTNLEQLIMKKVIFIAAMVFALNFSSKANEDEQTVQNITSQQPCMSYTKIMGVCPDGSPLELGTFGVIYNCETGAIISTAWTPKEGGGCTSNLIYAPEP